MVPMMSSISDEARDHRDAPGYPPSRSELSPDESGWYSTSRADTIHYIGQMAGELAKLALQARCPRLTYFLMKAQNDTETYF